MESSRLSIWLTISVVLHLFFLLSLVGRPGRPAGPAGSAGLISVSFISGAVPEARAEEHAPPESFLEEEEFPEEEELPEEVPQTEKLEEEPSSQPQSELPGDDSGSPGDGGLLDGTPRGLIEAPFNNPFGISFDRDTQAAEENRKCGDETDAQCAVCPEPGYPAQALRRKIEGQVVLKVEVLADGSVGDIYVDQGSGFPLLDNAALEGVKSWRFYPATSCGKPVIQQVVLPIVFQVE